MVTRAKLRLEDDTRYEAPHVSYYARERVRQEELASGACRSVRQLVTKRKEGPEWAGQKERDSGLDKWTE